MKKKNMIIIIVVIIILVGIGLYTYITIDTYKGTEKVITYGYLSKINQVIALALLDDNPNIPTKITDPNQIPYRGTIPNCVDIIIDSNDYSISGVIVVERYGFVIEDGLIIKGPVSKNSSLVKCNN